MGVYKNGENWYIDYRVQGVRKRKKIGPSHKVARLALKDVQVKIAQGKIGIEKPKNTPFSEFAQEYARFCKVNKARNTYERDCYTIEGSLKSFFGSKFLHNITAQDIERYKMERLDRVSPVTLNRDLSTLKHLFRMAVEWGYIKKNPAKPVKKIKVPKSPPHFIETKEGVERLLDACMVQAPEIYPLVVTALHTGMRKSELFNLRWEDIDFGRGALTACSREEWHTKNYESRTMPLREEVQRILEPMRKGEGLVFRPEEVKEKAFYKCVIRRLAKAGKLAGLEHFTLHSFRHTFVSHLIMSGGGLCTVQKLAGHKDIKTTMRYAHLAPDHLRMGMAMLDFGGHYMDTNGFQSEISPNQNRQNPLKNRNEEGKV